MGDPDEVRFFARIDRSDLPKVAGLAVAALVFVVSAALVAAASPAGSAGAGTGSAASPDPSSSPGASAAPHGNRGPGPSWRGLPFGPGPFANGGNGGVGPGGGFGPGGRGFGPGGVGLGNVTIAAIDGSNVSLKTDDGWTRTITIGSTTKLTKGGQTISVGDLRVGDMVRFSQTRNADGSYTINALDVVLPQVAGTVGQLTSGGFSLKARDGTTWTVTLNATTTYSFGPLAAGRKAGKSDVQTGDTVRVQGTTSGSSAITASSVFIALPSVFGQVSAKSGSTLTITLRDGSRVTVHVSGDTTYRAPGKSSAGLADVTVGQPLVVQGTKRADGSIDALSVLVGGPRAATPKQRPNGPAPTPSSTTSSYTQS